MDAQPSVHPLTFIRNRKYLKIPTLSLYGSTFEFYLFYIDNFILQYFIGYIVQCAGLGGFNPSPADREPLLGMEYVGSYLSSLSLG